MEVCGGASQGVDKGALASTFGGTERALVLRILKDGFWPRHAIDCFRAHSYKDDVVKCTQLVKLRI